jgi:hypothetical protein
MENKDTPLGLLWEGIQEFESLFLDSGGFVAKPEFMS